MNRKRKENESFEDYRANQNTEDRATKDKLAGRYVHISKQFTMEGRPLLGVTRVGSFKDEVVV